MGNIERLVPKDGLSPREFLQEFIKQFGDDITGVVVLALHKDGEMVDGWSSNVEKDVIVWLGAMEQLKLDFWNTLFSKRMDIFEE